MLLRIAYCDDEIENGKKVPINPIKRKLALYNKSKSYLTTPLSVGPK